MERVSIFSRANIPGSRSRFGFFISTSTVKLRDLKSASKPIVLTNPTNCFPLSASRVILIFFLGFTNRISFSGILTSASTDVISIISTTLFPCPIYSPFSTYLRLITPFSGDLIQDFSKSSLDISSLTLLTSNRFFSDATFAIVERFLI